MMAMLRILSMDDAMPRNRRAGAHFALEEPIGCSPSGNRLERANMRCRDAECQPPMQKAETAGHVLACRSQVALVYRLVDGSCTAASALMKPKPSVVE